jgi:hypothetical protein
MGLGSVNRVKCLFAQEVAWLGNAVKKLILLSGALKFADVLGSFVKTPRLIFPDG